MIRISIDFGVQEPSVSIKSITSLQKLRGDACKSLIDPLSALFIEICYGMVILGILVTPLLELLECIHASVSKSTPKYNSHKFLQAVTLL
jgi:hypothetical protein